LGTSGAIASAAHGHTYLAIDCKTGFRLVDCGDMPVARIGRSGLGIERLQGIIVTHFHPDHVATLPVLAVSTWLLGRTEPLPVYGLQDATERIAAMMDLFRADEWPHFPGLPCHAVAGLPGALVLENDELRITCSPTRHTAPSIGLRFENKASGAAVAYSSDTEPCDEVVTLASGVDILFHESTGDGTGHSSAAQAGTIGRRARAARLVLIHYPPGPADHQSCVAEASATFDGPVEMAQDYSEYEF
jgi:ribonuclease Z